MQFIKASEFLAHREFNGKIYHVNKEYEFLDKYMYDRAVGVQYPDKYRALALSVGGYIIDGYPEGKPRYQNYCEDLDLWTRMSDLYKEGKAIVVVPEVLCKYRKSVTDSHQALST